jgi:hypothetical protein
MSDTEEDLIVERVWTRPQVETQELSVPPCISTMKMPDPLFTRTRRVYLWKTTGLG